MTCSSRLLVPVGVAGAPVLVRVVEVVAAGPAARRVSPRNLQKVLLEDSGGVGPPGLPAAPGVLLRS